MSKFRSIISVLAMCGMMWLTVQLTIVWLEYKAFSRSPSSSVPVSVSLTEPGHIMRVSAYCPGSCCCGKWADGYTSSGVPAVGLIVAAPTDMPFGTVLQIPGYGTAQVQDRGGAITGNKLDVLFPTHQEALNWGRQYLKVKIY